MISFCRDSSSRPACWFTLAFLLYIILQFAITGRAAHNAAFYVFLIPALGAYLYTERAKAKAVFSHPVMQGFLLFFLFAASHGFLFLGEASGAMKSLRSSLQTATFFSAAVLFFSTASPLLRKQTLIAIGLVAGICSAISIGLFLTNPPQDPRLIPIGRATAQLPAAAVYSFGLICGLTALHHVTKWKYLLLLATSVAACFAVVVLTQARMSGFVCVIAILVVGAGFCRRNLRLFAALLGIAILVALVAPTLVGQSLSGYVEQMLSRGSSYRFDLWQLAWEKIVQHPWTGTGSSQIVHHQTDSPHNVFLATAMLMGLPALGLLLLVLGNLAVRVVQLFSLKDSYHRFIYLCLLNGMSLSMIDYNRIISGSSPLWMIFWLPLAIALAELIRLRELAKLQHGELLSA